MKKIRNVFWMVVLACAMVLLGAGVTVSAATIGDGYSIAGYNAGWVLLIVGVIMVALAWMMKFQKTVKTFMTWVFGALAVIGLIMLTVQAPATTVTDTDTTCCDFEVTGTAITSGGTWITTTAWEESTNTLTIPLTVADSSDGNLTGDSAGVNLTLEALGGETTQNCVFTITLDDTMTYGGEYLLDKSGSDYCAEIHTASGTEYGSDKVQVAAGSTAWVNCSFRFVNATSGSWVSELSAIGDSITWYTTVQNACGESVRITITAIVVSYTA